MSKNTNKKIDINKYRGKKTAKSTKKYRNVRLTEEAYAKVKTISVQCECSFSGAIVNHLHLTK